jgi:hypothetical protein
LALTSSSRQRLGIGIQSSNAWDRLDLCRKLFQRYRRPYASPLAGPLDHLRHQATEIPRGLYDDRCDETCFEIAAANDLVLQGPVLATIIAILFALIFAAI